MTDVDLKTASHDLAVTLGDPKANDDLFTLLRAVAAIMAKKAEKPDMKPEDKIEEKPAR